MGAKAEETGFEPASPCGRRFSKPVPYRSAHSSKGNYTLVKVRPKGIEPLFLDPQSKVLSIKLWALELYSFSKGILSESHLAERSMKVVSGTSYWTLGWIKAFTLASS